MFHILSAKIVAYGQIAAEINLLDKWVYFGSALWRTLLS